MGVRFTKHFVWTEQVSSQASL